jgi:hypothetical protein
MSVGDYQGNEPYASCRAKSDDAAVASLESSYLEEEGDGIRYYPDISRTLYGRGIPYAPNAHRRFRRRDASAATIPVPIQRFRCITLQEAERDPFYVRDTVLNLPPGANTLERAMAERQMLLPTPPVPSVQLNSLCR